MTMRAQLAGRVGIVAAVVAIWIVGTAAIANAQETIGGDVNQDPAYVEAQIFTDALAFTYHAGGPGSCRYPNFMLGDHVDSVEYDEMHQEVVEYMLGEGLIYETYDVYVIDDLVYVTPWYYATDSPLVGWSGYPVGGAGNCIHVFYNAILTACPDATGFDNPIWTLPIVRDATNLEDIWGWYGGNSWYGQQCLEVATYEEVYASIMDSVGLIRPSGPLNPIIQGLTGLDTWAWYEIADEFAGRDPYVDGFTIDLPTAGNPISIDVTLWLTEIRWDLDGDESWDHIEACGPRDPTVVGPTGGAPSFVCGGSADDPVIDDFLYRTAQDYDMTNELQWVGFFDMDLTFTSRQFLDTDLLLSALTRTYTVRSARSVLIDPDA